jgi:hypothetical protein
MLKYSCEVLEKILKVSLVQVSLIEPIKNKKIDSRNKPIELESSHKTSHEVSLLFWREFKELLYPGMLKEIVWRGF